MGGGFVFFVIIIILVVIGKVLQAAQEGKARAEQQRRGRAQGGAARKTEYSSPAQEVRQFLEQVRQRQGQMASQQRRAAAAAPAQRAAGPAQDSGRGDECDSDAQHTAHEQAREVREGAAARIGRAQKSVAQAKQSVVDQKKRLQAMRTRPKAVKRVKAPQRREAPREAVELVPLEPVIGSGLGAHLDSAADLRRAIVLSEILAPPIALRRPGGAGPAV